MDASAVLVALNQLRYRLTDVQEADPKLGQGYYLAMWLKRKGFDLDKTEAAIRESIKWRETKYAEIFGNDIDREEDLEEIVAISVHTGTLTKQGQPVGLIKGDGVDFKSSISKHGRDKVLNYLVKLFYKLELALIDHYSNKSSSNDCEPSTSSGVGVKSNGKSDLTLEDADVKNLGMFIIGSFKEFSLTDALSLDAIHVLLEFSRIVTRYFPCLASAVYLININKFAQIIFKLVKPIIASQAYTIECFDSNENKYSAALSNFIQLNQLAPNLILKNVDKDKDKTSSKTPTDPGSPTTAEAVTLAIL